MGAETEAAKAKKKARRASNSGILMRTTTNRSNRVKARGHVQVQMSSTEGVWWEAKQTAMGQAVMTTKTAPVLTPGSEEVFGAGSEITKVNDISNEKNSQENVDAIMAELQRAREAQEEVTMGMLSAKALAELNVDLEARIASNPNTADNTPATSPVE